MDFKHMQKAIVKSGINTAICYWLKVGSVSWWITFLPARLQNCPPKRWVDGPLAKLLAVGFLTVPPSLNMPATPRNWAEIFLAFS